MAIDWGIAHGNLDDVAHTSTSRLQEQYLSTAAQILPAGGWIRYGIKASNAASASAFNQATHDNDQLAYTIAKYGLNHVVSFHLGSSPYEIPTRDGTGAMTNWYNWIQSALSRYAPGGTFTNGSVVSVYGVNQTVSGYVAPVRYEIWNEPNSIGNCGVTTNLGGLLASDAYDILYYGSKAVRDHAAAHAWTPYIIAFGLANTGTASFTSYWTSIVNYGLSSGRTYTIGGTTYGPNPHDFCDAVGAHPYSSADPALSTGSGNPIRLTLGNLRSYMDANGGSAKDIYLTEMGWRGWNGPGGVHTAGSNRYNGGASNTEWEGIVDQGVGEASQELWEMAGIDTLNSLTSLKVKGSHHYEITDDDSGGSTQVLGLTRNALAANANGPIPSTSWKAVARAMQTKLASPAPPPPTGTVVNVITRGGKIRLVV